MAADDADAAAKNDRLDRPRSDLSPSSLGAVPQQRRLGTVQQRQQRLRHRCCADELSISSAACLCFVARWKSCRPWLYCVVVVGGRAVERAEREQRRDLAGHGAVRPLLRHLTVTDMIANRTERRERRATDEQPRPVGSAQLVTTHTGEAYLVSKERRRLAARRGVQVYS